MFRSRMNCQIVHDSLHGRDGWTHPYFLEFDGRTVGYASIAVGGPWRGTRTVFEFFVLPGRESRPFDLFECFLAASEATAFEVQSNDLLLTAMLHTYARNIKSDKIVFEDSVTTAHSLDGFTFRKQPDDEGGEFVLEAERRPGRARRNHVPLQPPLRDIYMAVAEPFRERGLGSYLVQELKTVCYRMGSIPCARCSPDNIASRKTLQKAGFVPRAHILTGTR